MFNNNMKIKYLFGWILPAICLGMILPRLVFGIAMVAEPIVFLDAMRGTELSKDLLLMNSESRTVIYHLKAEGQIADWTSFYENEDADMATPVAAVEMSPGARQNVTVKFSIPDDIGNGTYKGLLTITEMAGKTQGGDISSDVNLMIDREVEITVTDKEVFALKTSIIPLKYDVPKGDFLQFKVIYDNEGNTAIKPDISLKVIDPNSGEVFHNAIYPYPENAKAVRPHEQKDMGAILGWSTAGQKEGTYEAQTKILLNDKQVFEGKTTFAITGMMIRIMGANLSIGWPGKLEAFWYALGAIVLVAAVALKYVNGKRVKSPELPKAE
jgi:hypothetical protein